MQQFRLTNVLHACVWLVTPLPQLLWASLFMHDRWRDLVPPSHWFEQLVQNVHDDQYGQT